MANDIFAISGYRDDHPKAEHVPDGSAGVIHHPAGVGSIRVQLHGDFLDVHISGRDLAMFARAYSVLGSECLARLKELDLTEEDFKQLEIRKHGSSDKRRRVWP